MVRKIIITTYVNQLSLAWDVFITIHIHVIFVLDRRKSSSGAETTLSRASYKSLKSNKNNFGRKLEMEFNKNLCVERRRLKSNEKNLSSSSSANSDAENDAEIDVVLNQSRLQLENTEALKIRRHLLRAEDYVSWTKLTFSSAYFKLTNIMFVFFITG